ncbi:MAG: response regulator transcription factor [Planctomycetaceae bacterium]|nr:response regulator transcription factor [Planctomycetaceae bacterium]
MSKKRLLIIEDEVDVLDMLELRLVKERFEVLKAANGETGLQKAVSEEPDLILLDLMLPLLPGLDVLKSLRANLPTANTPVLILSARGEESDIIVGLELGADDYVVKPFGMSVLVARINALLRRTASSEEDAANFLRLGAVEIDVDRFQAFVDGSPITLTKTEFRILYALATSKGRVLTRNQLIDKAIGADAMVTDRTIDVHLTSLRTKLGTARDVIETVRGIGYRFNARSTQQN